MWGLTLHSVCRVRKCRRRSLLGASFCSRDARADPGALFVAVVTGTCKNTDLPPTRISDSNGTGVAHSQLKQRRQKIPAAAVKLSPDVGPTRNREETPPVGHAAQQSRLLPFGRPSRKRLGTFAFLGTPASGMTHRRVSSPFPQKLDTPELIVQTSSSLTPWFWFFN